MARSSRYEMDMTQGALLPKVLMFSLPLIASGILQLLFNAADMVVVGRWAGKECLAAVGSTGSLINLMVNVFIGLSVGGSVAVARAFGANDPVAVHRGVHTAMTLAIIAGLVVGLVGFIFCRPLLAMMDNPVLDLATTYMKIYFLGMPFNMIYNFGASILRAVGDTRRPLIYLTIAGVVNVVLNLILVIFFHMTVDGVAIATVTSQAVSAVLVVTCLMRSTGVVHLDLRDLRIHKREFALIARVGLPAGLQGSLFSISNVLIQSSVNSFGDVVVAANSAGSNLEGFVYTSMNAIHQAALTFASQNLGARKLKRIEEGTKQGLIMAAGLSAAITVILLFLNKFLFGFFTDTAELIDLAGRMMRIMAVGYVGVAVTQVLGGVMRGCGDTMTPMWISMISTILLRIPVAYGMAYLTASAAWPNGHPFSLSTSLLVSWTLGAVITFVAFRRGKWRKAVHYADQAAAD